MQEVKVRFGVRADGFPLVESRSYVDVPEDYPNAMAVDGLDGWWVQVSVGGDLDAEAAESGQSVRVTDRAGYVAAWAAWHQALDIPVPPLPSLPEETIR